jgi:hypothetical protein
MLLSIVRQERIHSQIPVQASPDSIENSAKQNFNFLFSISYLPIRGMRAERCTMMISFHRHSVSLRNDNGFEVCRTKSKIAFKCKHDRLLSFPLMFKHNKFRIVTWFDFQEAALIEILTVHSFAPLSLPLILLILIHVLCDADPPGGSFQVIVSGLISGGQNSLSDHMPRESECRWRRSGRLRIGNSG